MWITPQQWSAAALQRAARDGSVVVLRPGFGVASDVEVTRGLRAAALESAVPRGAALTGVSALWVAGWRAADAAPRALTVAVRRGAHPDRPTAYDGPWRYVTDDAAVRDATRGQSPTGMLMVDTVDACVAALAHEPEEVALPAVHWALHRGSVSAPALRSRLGRVQPHAQRARAQRLLDLLVSASAAA